ncbi:chromate transporter [Fusobacterium ulcerans]|uniref:chromate transporter n=1 Tax=Fusobacterium ulcerans TaxID=861 RepID=UPI0021C26275|nr:chromate transporter [Fusobacterium ulcerans]
MLKEGRKMIYLELLIGFLKVGCFSFGGAYGAIPLIRDVALSYGWLSDERLTYLIAVSESTPGPIMVNLATFVGSSKAGLLGSTIATLAVVFPSFVVILVLMSILKTALKNKYFQSVLQGLKPSIIGIILATGVYMALENCISNSLSVDYRNLFISILLTGVIAVHTKVKKKEVSPIILICCSACISIVVYSM